MSKKFFYILFLICGLSAFAGQVMATEKTRFFSSETACQSALEDENYSFYEPAVNSPAPKSWHRKYSSANECVHGWTTQGWQWVVIPKGFEKAYDPIGKRWVMAKCQNAIDDKENVVQALEPAAVMSAPTCDEKCQAVKVCEKEKGTLTQKSSEFFCTLPSTKVYLVQPIEVSGRVEYVWKGWTDNGLTVPAPAPRITVEASRTVVNINACGSTCVDRTRLPPPKVCDSCICIPSIDALGRPVSYWIYDGRRYSPGERVYNFQGDWYKDAIAILN